MLVGGQIKLVDVKIAVAVTVVWDICMSFDQEVCVLVCDVSEDGATICWWPLYHSDLDCAFDMRWGHNVKYHIWVLVSAVNYPCY